MSSLLDLHRRAQAVEQRLGVPVADGANAAVKLAEALVALGLKTEKARRLRPTAAQALGGWAADLG